MGCHSKNDRLPGKNVFLCTQFFLFIIHFCLDFVWAFDVCQNMDLYKSMAKIMPNSSVSSAWPGQTFHLFFDITKQIIRSLHFLQRNTWFSEIKVHSMTCNALSLYAGWFNKMSWRFVSHVYRVLHEKHDFWFPCLWSTPYRCVIHGVWINILWRFYLDSGSPWIIFLLPTKSLRTGSRFPAFLYFGGNFLNRPYSVRKKQNAVK